MMDTVLFLLTKALNADVNIALLDVKKKKLFSVRSSAGLWN